ncbi:YecA family protein [Herbaspirillum rubrisubalbicans M1]|uniref:YecA/YgfB family protein n=1 Tax=Herbaspirillum rubrisubalbicans TaxID=80842 RepID=UPI00073A0753|nr:YecA family protein [Herbaspirillum rubrisubalbicans]ALU88103.1 YecA family protein [Herbaspirillum rubrisubalbicans M1]
MHNHLLQQPLNDDELDRLGEFLEEAGSPGMNIELLDGYFAALICGPEAVLPSEYLPQLLGEEPPFENQEEASDILGLIMRHWNTIASTLARTLEEDMVYLPVLLEDEHGVAHGNDWAQGFMHGVHCRLGAWEELLESEEFGEFMLPIFALVHEHDPDPNLRPPAITPDKRDAVLQAMIVSVTHIYRYFVPHRRSAVRMTSRRAGPKISRNDPCPCGSGRKYKYCCAAGAPTIH